MGLNKKGRKWGRGLEPVFRGRSQKEARHGRCFYIHRFISTCIYINVYQYETWTFNLYSLTHIWLEPVFSAHTSHYGTWTCNLYSQAHMGFNGVLEAAVFIASTDEADSVEGGVIQSVLVGLHLANHRTAVMFPKGVTSVRSTDWFFHPSIPSHWKPVNTNTSLKVKKTTKHWFVASKIKQETPWLIHCVS